MHHEYDTNNYVRDIKLFLKFTVTLRKYTVPYGNLKMGLNPRN